MKKGKDAQSHGGDSPDSTTTMMMKGMLITVICAHVYILSGFQRLCIEYIGVKEDKG